MPNGRDADHGDVEREAREQTKAVLVGRHSGERQRGLFCYRRL